MTTTDTKRALAKTIRTLHARLSSDLGEDRAGVPAVDRRQDAQLDGRAGGQLEA